MPLLLALGCRLIPAWPCAPHDPAPFLHDSQVKWQCAKPIRHVEPLVDTIFPFSSRILVVFFGTTTGPLIAAAHHPLRCVSAPAVPFRGTKDRESSHHCSSAKGWHGGHETLSAGSLTVRTDPNLPTLEAVFRTWPDQVFQPQDVAP